jgi:hypothetical protein
MTTDTGVGLARVWTLEMPPRTEWMTSNDHKGGYGRRKRLTEEMLTDARWVIKAARMPRLERARIVAAYCPAKHQRLDPGNWYPSAKPYVDALVAEGVLPDDDTEHVIGPDMRLGDPHPPCPRMVLRVAELQPLLRFDCVTAKAAAAVAEYARLIVPPGVDLTDRARASGKTVTVMFDNPWFAADLAAWAALRGHTPDLA